MNLIMPFSAVHRIIDDTTTIPTNANPCFYIYGINNANINVVGILATMPVNEVNKRILRHEQTLQNKVEKQTQAFLESELQINPVLLTHLQTPTIDNLLNQIISASPTIAFSSEQTTDTVHQLWKVDDLEIINVLKSEYEYLNKIYIADGHHRIDALTQLSFTENFSGRFLSLLVGAHQLHIKSYHRFISSIELSLEQLILKLEEFFVVSKTSKPKKPDQKYEYLIYTHNFWLKLTFKTQLLEQDNILTRFDFYVINQYLFSSIFNISNIRTDERVKFIPDTYTVDELQEKISNTSQLILLMPPLLMEDLLFAADSNIVLPPNSSWIEPKLINNLVCYDLFSKSEIVQNQNHKELIS